MNQINESLETIADHTSQSLIEAAANAAFKLFRNKHFRGYADFGAPNQHQHDRTFNVRIEPSSDKILHAKLGAIERSAVKMAQAQTCRS